MPITRIWCAGEKLARWTSTGYAPWVVIPSGDPRYRDMAMGRTIQEAVRKRLDGDGTAPTPAAPAIISAPGRRTALDALDLSLSVAKPEYDRKLRTLQDRLAALSDGADFREIGLILAFEGNDAAGKGGSIRRVTQALDPRRFHVHSIAAPSDEEKAQPYLGRFWWRLPRQGAMSPFAIGAGTGGCWSSASRASARKPNGCAPTARSTTSRLSCRTSGSSSSSSGWR